jgi:hypothetical protein
MIMRLRTALTMLVLAVVALASGGDAQASDLAPAFGTEELREVARAELKRQLAVLEPESARKLVGTYVVFEPDAADPLAAPGCDDDGDHVVVLSDAMLRLVADVAHAGAIDEATGSRHIEDYSAFLARVQVPGRKLLPPPPGFYLNRETAKGAATEDDRLHEGVAFVVGHELARLRAGDLVCPRATATRESGDDTWTVDEHRRAMREAARVFGTGGTQSVRDEEATTRMLASGRGTAGALFVLRFFEQYERDRMITTSRFAPTYLVHHPTAAIRAGSVRAAAAAAAERTSRDGGRTRL